MKKYIKRLLGIDEILKNIEEIKSEIKNQPEEEQELKNSLQFVNPIDNKPFLHVESLIDSPNKYETKSLRPIGSSEKIMSLIQYLPIVQTAKQSKMLKGAYKVVFPEGAVGELMRYKNGMLGTPLVNNGKIGNTHAGLVELQNLSLTPVMVFTAISAITGQYFMARINKSLESISKDVREIISMFLDDKKAKNKAIFGFYTYIRNNLNIIINNSDLRIATLTNLQSYLVELKQNLLFYESTIKRYRERTHLADERDMHRAALDSGEALELPPQAHLRSPHLPYASGKQRTTRFLHVWATLSTPLLLIALGTVMVLLRGSLALLAALGVVVLFAAFDALARRRFLSFLVGLALVVVAVGLVSAVIAAFLVNWRITVLVPMALAVVSLLYINLRDLLRR